MVGNQGKVNVSKAGRKSSRGIEVCLPPNLLALMIDIDEYCFGSV